MFSQVFGTHGYYQVLHMGMQQPVYIWAHYMLPLPLASPSTNNIHTTMTPPSRPTFSIDPPVVDVIRGWRPQFVNRSSNFPMGPAGAVFYSRHRHQVSYHTVKANTGLLPTILVCDQGSHPIQILPVSQLLLRRHNMEDAGSIQEQVPDEHGVMSTERRALRSGCTRRRLPAKFAAYASSVDSGTGYTGRTISAKPYAGARSAF
ncbi:hypothetical protein C8Q74DRAFT_1221593 [Fomes fomentarius]|nr:hypothetical protein C8Q74DRAFT_1221593 [Fomes fomentarius]